MSRRCALLVLVLSVGCQAGVDDESDAASAPLDGGSDAAAQHDAATALAPTALDHELLDVIKEQGLTGDPATPRGRVQTRPSEDPLVRLGQVLFFSQTLSAGFDSSCGTCHHPDNAGADMLSISVGVVPLKRSVVGEGRKVARSRDLDPLADGGPNMHRNSPTTFNAALLDRALFADGRLFVVDDTFVSGGLGQAMRTPESGNRVVKAPKVGMLEEMVQFPLMNDNEMRGFMYTDLTDPVKYREHVLDRLRGRTEADLLAPGAAKRWLALFRAAFAAPDADAGTLITMANVSTAVAAFIESQIFVDTPWKRYVDGDLEAIDASAKQGALAFLKAQEAGGLGCSGCHAGDRFTSEEFRNVGFPQIGRGFRRADRRDVGRWLVTRESSAWLTIRVPSLLNVALTAPYGHAGTFQTLEALLRYHANPRAAVDDYDFGLKQLPQFADGKVSYPDAEKFTRESIASSTFAEAEADLPKRALTDDEVKALEAFLSALTDQCAGDRECRDAWTPAAELDPDGHMLVRDRDVEPPVVDAQRPSGYPAYVDLSYGPVTTRTTFSDVQSCANGLATAKNTNQSKFLNRTNDEAFGLTAPHGFTTDTWNASGIEFESIMIAGGASAAYLDDDCWPDLAYAGGESSGLVFYMSRGEQLGYAPKKLLSSALATSLGRMSSGVAIADLNGDYRRELVIGNVLAGDVNILSMADDGTYQQVGALPTTRNTFGVSFGVLQDAEYPSLYLGHWSPIGAAGSAPALFHNADGSRLQPYDKLAKTSSAYVDQPFNFTPKFADIDRDGHQDLVIASDFLTSSALHNAGGGVFTNVTDRDVLSDDNGMGSALGDFDNDGLLDWFVTSVFVPDGVALGNWGVTGNRLYRNVSKPGTLRFEDDTSHAGVRDGGWGWGACAADFNQDGFLDIFHVNGFGRAPAGVADKDYYDSITPGFQDMAPRLFINAGDGTFSDQAKSWGLDVPSEGRSVACFDYDRDGDIDIVLLAHSVGLQFFENQTGHGKDHGFLNVRVLGAAPNTEALGARVTVTAQVGPGNTQTQLRVSEANSNFNGQSLPDLHFGLGSALVVDELRVSWPGDSTPLVCKNVAIDQFLVFDQRDEHCPSK